MDVNLWMSLCGCGSVDVIMWMWICGCHYVDVDLWMSLSMFTGGVCVHAHMRTRVHSCMHAFVSDSFRHMRVS